MSHIQVLNHICVIIIQKGVKGESHIDFRTQCVIMTLGVGEAITNVVVKFTKDIEFQSS